MRQTNEIKLAEIIIDAAGIKKYIEANAKEVEEEFHEYYGSYEGDDDDPYFEKEQSESFKVDANMIERDLNEKGRKLFSGFTADSIFPFDVERNGVTGQQVWSLVGEINDDLYDEESAAYQIFIEITVKDVQNKVIEVSACEIVKDIDDATLEKILQKYALIF